MGCCGSKKESGEAFTSIAEAAGDAVPKTTEQAGTALAGAGTIAGSAVIGAAIAGPAAPLGAIIGAAVGAALARKTAGTVGSVVVAPVGLMKDMWRGLVNRKELLDQLPDIGMLRSEREVYPPAMTELTETNRCTCHTALPHESPEHRMID